MHNMCLIPLVIMQYMIIHGWTGQGTNVAERTGWITIDLIMTIDSLPQKLAAAY